MNRLIRAGLRSAQALLVVLLLGTIQAGAEGAAPPAVGEQAKDFALMALDGTAVSLSTLNDDAPVVLVVLRGYPGYQCPMCTKQFAEFRNEADQFKASGARVVFVYPGLSDKLKERAQEFVKGKDYPAHFQILLDPDYKFTDAYGLRWHAKGETAYPSTFVIGSNRSVKFAKVSRTHGGRAGADEALKALDGR